MRELLSNEQMNVSGGHFRPGYPTELPGGNYESIWPQFETPLPVDGISEVADLPTPLLPSGGTQARNFGIFAGRGNRDILEI